MTRANLKKVALYSIVLAAAAILYAVAGRFDFTPRPGRLGPAVWPRAILILTIIVCIYEIVRTILVRKEQEKVEGLLEIIQEQSAERLPEDIHEEPQGAYRHLLAGGIGLTAGYVLLFNVLGFFLDTLLFMILFMLVGRYRKPGVVLVGALFGSLAFMYVFMKIVYVSLPIGHAPFSAVSLALMQLMGIR
jgi:putative tricarboxylic transport membrane protein